MKKIKIGYITALSHTGSSLLDILLGAQRGIENVGEVINFDCNTQCACGSLLKNCDYWRDILKRTGKFLSNKWGIQKYKSVLKKTLPSFTKGNPAENMVFIKNFLSEGIEGCYSKEQLERYYRVYYGLYKSILEKSHKDIISDSSKHPLRLLILSKSPLFDIKIIYLFRDLRANLESKKRRTIKRNPGMNINLFIVKRSIFFIFRILAQKYLLSRVSSDDLLGVSYRAFTQRSGYTLKKICDFLETDFDRETLLPNNDDFFNNRETHSLGGRSLSMSKVENIKFIKKWDDGLNFYDKMVFKLFGGSLLNYLQRTGNYRIIK